MSTTNYLGLNIPDKNSKGRVVTDVFEPNFTKLDQNAEVVDRDKNAIWGGLDGGGLIEDPSVTKVVGKRYIGADGKAYICLVPSNINNSTNYVPCNVVDNLNRLQNLVLGSERVTKIDNGNTKVVIVNCYVDIDGTILGSGGEILSLGIYGIDIADGAQGAGALSDELNNFIPCTFFKNSANKIQVFFEKDKLLATGNYSIRGSLISFSSSK